MEGLLRGLVLPRVEVDSFFQNHSCLLTIKYHIEVLRSQRGPNKKTRSESLSESMELLKTNQTTTLQQNLK